MLTYLYECLIFSRYFVKIRKRLYRWSMRSLMVFMMVLGVACTQTPVEVVHKGDQQYTYDATVKKTSATRSVNSLRFRTGEVAQAERVETAIAQPQFVYVPVQMTSVTPVQTRDLVAQPAPAVAPQPALTAKNFFTPAAPANAGKTPVNITEPKPLEAKWHAAKAANVATVEGFIWPVRGKLVSGFGQQQNGQQNDGINIAAKEGKAVKAAADGVVVYAGNELASYGNMVILRHNNGWMSAYAHLDAPRVAVDDEVRQGQVLGGVGTSGQVSTAQLHFGLRKDQQAVNPLDFLSDSLAAIH